MDALNGHNPRWSRLVSKTCDEDQIMVEGCHFTINSKLIEVAIEMVNSSRRHSREEKTPIFKV